MFFVIKKVFQKFSTSVNLTVGLPSHHISYLAYSWSIKLYMNKYQHIYIYIYIYIWCSRRVKNESLDVKVGVELPTVLETISLENILPLLGLYSDSCFYGDILFTKRQHMTVVEMWSILLSFCRAFRFFTN